MYGQFNTLDMGVSVFPLVGGLAFAIAQSPDGERARRGWMLVGWAACALAVLSKGLIGIVLPAAAVALYVSSGATDAAAPARAIRAACCSSPSPSPGSWSFRCAIPSSRTFFSAGALAAFTTTMHQRSHPAGYFVPCWPWAWPLAARRARRLARGLRRPGPAAFRTAILACGTGRVRLLFRLRLQLPGYILPLCLRCPCSAGVCGAHGGPAACSSRIGHGPPWLGWRSRPPALTLCHRVQTGSPSSRRVYGSASAAASVLAASGCSALCSPLRSRPSRASACSPSARSPPWLIGIVGTRLCRRSSAPRVRSPRWIRRLGRHAVLAVDSLITACLSCAGTVTMVRYKDEFSGEAVTWEPGKFIPDLAGFAASGTRPANPYALFALRDFERCANELGCRMEIVARGPRYIVVRKP